MCADSTLQERPLLAQGTVRYRYHYSHPMNRYPDDVRNKLESHLDMVLRSDPAGATGATTCRLYSPEINTHEKLGKLLQKALDEDESINAELSASTLQRMVSDYLTKRNYVISFTQSDHNACPNCKTMQYAILQFHHEASFLQAELEELSRSPRPMLEADQGRLASLYDSVASKKFQEDECVKEMKVHNSRDSRIRATIKRMGDHFRDVENRYRRVSIDAGQSQGQDSVVSWNMYPDRACITHQDDMSKVDLPHFMVMASSDITRWRYAANAHVSSVRNDATVFSHEQGSGAKTGATIVEEILLNHLLTCRGEAIKVIVSDNASVGKNWLTTIALPQYLVDQGLCDIAIVVFLENNHGKWLADMLFGQFQSRKKREVLLGVDDMLGGFEDVRWKNGKVEGFVLKPLSSIDFAKVLSSLGYETKPRSEFGFLRRNIHFSGACAPGVKQRLPFELRQLLGSVLPDDIGMVRVATEPPGRPQGELEYEDRYLDVPAARIEPSETENDDGTGALEDGEGDVPLVVPIDMDYSPGGNGVVSTRTMKHVGYNGIEFRKLNACPEMKDTSRPLVRRAWPKGLLESLAGGGRSDEPVNGSESTKCAPLNWVVRRPVRWFCAADTDWKARYPPMNMLNAKYGQGTRELSPWVPTATYEEPPSPVTEGTAACSALKRLEAQHTDIREQMNVLDVLRAVFMEMVYREGVSDRWLQRRATVPSRTAIERYRSEIQLDIERERGRPQAPMAVRQAFKKDSKVLDDVALMLLNMTVTGSVAQKLRTQALSKLFEEAEGTPGGLDRFYRIVEKDQERYARELKIFTQKKRDFDRDHGLLPHL